MRQFENIEDRFLKVLNHFNTIPLDRLEEICNAERDGRCVVLPCKVGDTVFVITDCADVLKNCDDDYYNGTGAIECPFEKDCIYEECDDTNRIIAKTICTGFWIEQDGIWKVFLDHITADIGITDFGKTVFLTQAEAEAALKGDK